MENEHRGFMFEPRRSKVFQAQEERNSVKKKEVKPSSMKYDEARLQNLFWCHCKHCDCMPSAEECICCTEVDEVNAKLSEEKSAHSCITRLHTSAESFEIVCLRTDVLEVVSAALNDVLGNTSESSFTNKKYRYAAYRSYIWWIYGKLGINRRKVIPSCVVLAIRNKFPEPDGKYEGYHSCSNEFRFSSDTIDDSCV